jgi:hypothetical protein
VKRWLLLSSLLIFLTGCGNSSPPLGTSTPPTNDTSESAPEATPSSSPRSSDADPKSSLISASGIGPAQLGMTLGELKQIVGTETEFTVQSPFIVDFDAIAISQSGEVQYYILYLAGQSFTDADVIQGLLTSNSKFHTAADIGPGTLIQQAEQAYGKATLSYNTENDSREYVRFENQPAPNISFSTGNATQETAGVYSSPTGGYNETQEFKENTAIASVLVVCLDEDCAGSQ